MKFLITGGAGFVGSALVRELLAREAAAEIVVLDSFCTGQYGYLPKSPRVKVAECDLRDCEGVWAAIQQHRPQRVIHLAAIHFIPRCNEFPAEAVAVNIGGTQNLLDACRKQPPESLVIASSAAVYPISDEYQRESARPAPTDIYGLTKWCNEEQLQLFANQTQTKCAVARISNVYGPRETNPHIVPEIVYQMLCGATAIRLGNTAPKRDYVHVQDVAAAFARLSLTPVEPFAIYNVGTGAEYSVVELVAALGRISGRELQIETDGAKVRKTDRPFLRSDVSRMQNELGFRASYDLERGLTDLWQWAVEHPEAARRPFEEATCQESALIR
jgi:UDP-glucose 4-epimerase